MGSRDHARAAEGPARGAGPAPPRAPRPGAAAGPERLGRYELLAPIASGGMASVYLGRVEGPAGFSRPVAIKRLHAHYEQHPDLLAALVDEARLSARIRHPNVVDTLDVVAERGTLALVLPYVHGESLSRLLRVAGERGERPPPAVAVAVVGGALQGLHAAHETRDERGRPLELVHRDVSPHNILVGADGTARIADFGIAKAASQLHATREGQVKGKLGYMAPEQARGGPVDRRTDVFAAGIVLWEALAARRLFTGESDAEVLYQMLEKSIVPPSSVAPGAPPELDAIVLRALCRDPAGRFPTALAMADALDAAIRPARPADVAAWVQHLAGEQLARRQAEVDCSERPPASSPDPARADESPTRPTAPRTRPPPPAAPRRDDPAVPAASRRDNPATPAAPRRDNPATPATYLADGTPPPRPSPSKPGLAAALAATTLALLLVTLWRAGTSRSPADYVTPSPSPAIADATASIATPSPPTPATSISISSAPPSAGPAPSTAPPATGVSAPSAPPRLGHHRRNAPPASTSGTTTPRAPAGPPGSTTGGVRDRSDYWGQQ